MTSTATITSRKSSGRAEIAASSSRCSTASCGPPPLHHAVEVLRIRRVGRPPLRRPVLVEEHVAHRAEQVAEVVLVADHARAREHPRVGLLHEVVRGRARAGERARGAVEAIEMVAQSRGVERPRHPRATLSGRTPTALVGFTPAMIFTTKAEYGVRLLVQLGLQGGRPARLAQGDRRGRVAPARLPRADRGAAQEGRHRRGDARGPRRLHARPARGGDHDGPGRPRARRAHRPDGLLLRRPRRPRALLPSRRWRRPAPPSCCGRACRWASSSHCSAPRWRSW